MATSLVEKALGMPSQAVAADRIDRRRLPLMCELPMRAEGSFGLIWFIRTAICDRIMSGGSQ